MEQELLSFVVKAEAMVFSLDLKIFTFLHPASQITLLTFSLQVYLQPKF